MSAPRAPRIAIAHDYLTQRGGAERVVLSMARAFPDAPIYTTLYDPGSTFADFADLDVRPSPLNRLTLLRRHHRLALPLLRWASKRVDIDADVVLCSSSGWAHGFGTSGVKVVYCYSPARWLYQTETYLGDRKATAGSLAIRALRRPLVKWDIREAQGALAYLAISEVVRDRIRATYGIDATVVPAPVSPEFLGAIPEAPTLVGSAGVTSPFFLCVSRLLPYKNVAAVISAFSNRSETLVVVGRGPERERLAAEATANVIFLEGLSDAEVRWLYESCVALVAASYEDFGLTPLEAASCGRPSVVLRAGGYLDTMNEHTGVFFDDPTDHQISAALDEAAQRTWDPDQIRAHASGFSESRFIDSLQAVVRRAAVSTKPQEERR